MTDIIADALTRVRNALRVKKSEVFLLYSKLLFSLFKILEDKKLIAKVEIVKSENPKLKKRHKKRFNEIKIVLKYDKKNLPNILNLQRVSCPSRRVYLKTKEIKSEARSMLIVSTPAGLMTDKEAWEKNLGGEIICKIYTNLFRIL